MFKSKTKPKLNRKNRMFKKELPEPLAEKVFNTMEFISLDNRAVATQMAFDAFVKIYGKPLYDQPS